jgi:hypothetical protein
MRHLLAEPMILPTSRLVQMALPLQRQPKEESNREWLRLYNFPVVVLVVVLQLVAFVALAVQPVLAQLVVDQSECQLLQAPRQQHRCHKSHQT